MAYVRKRTSAPGALLISIEEFANRMGCSLSTARKLAYGRRISTVKFTKNLMVPAAEVDRLIAENLTPAESVCA
jgi:hypothetical protein